MIVPPLLMLVMVTASRAANVTDVGGGKGKLCFHAAILIRPTTFHPTNG
jgi:hypothetical protein